MRPATADGRYVAADTGAVGRFDLLTVLEHEFGHLLGLSHDAAEGVMHGQLDPGIRLLPSGDEMDGLFSDARVVNTLLDDN